MWSVSGLSAKWLKRAFIALIALILGGFVFFAVDEWFNYRAAEAESLQILATATARNIESYFDDQQTDLAFLGSTLIEEDALANYDKAEEFIALFKKHHAELSAVHIYLPDGALHSSTFFGPSDHAPRLGDVDKHCIQSSRLCVLPTRKNITQSGWEIPMVYPVVDGGKTRFLLRVDLSLDNQQFLWHNSPLPPGMHISLMRMDGKLQSRFPSVPDFDSWRTSKPLDEIRRQSGASHGVFSGDAGQDGENRLGAYQRLENYPLLASVSIPSATYWMHWRAAMEIPLLATFGMLALCLIGYRYLRLNSIRIGKERQESEAERVAREEQHKVILRTAMDGYLLVDANGQLVEVNDAYCAMSGYRREELLGMTLSDLGFEKSQTKLAALKRDIVSRGSLKFETVQRRRDGSRLDLEISVNYLPSNRGLFFAFIRDITDRKQSEAEFHAEKELAHVTLESIGDAVITTDADGRINYLNPVAELLTGWKNQDASGRPLHEVFRIVNETTRQHIESPVETVLREGKIVEIANHAVLISSSGSEYAIEDSAAPIRNREGKIIGVVLVFHDVTDTRELIERVTWQAGHDALTGLPNRMLLQDRIAQAMASARRQQHLLAVLFLDLDGFKEVNDRFGHATGDILLKTIADRLLSTLRAGDTVSRLGGDEFVMLIEVDKHSEIELCLERIVDAVKRPVALDGTSVRVSPSIGLTIYPMNDADADTLLRHADMAMYQAKQSGRDQYRIFDVQMDQRARTSLEIKERVAQALAAREFVLYYQPKVDMRRGKVVGAEALIRWIHPERGLLPPVEFLPFVEATELIAQIGKWVIDEALEQLDRWSEAGLDLSISVNIAAHQLQSPGFLDELKAALARHPKTDASRLELEILETTALDDIPMVQRVLNGCKAAGVRLSLDDFGTGYSSLSYLKHLPVDTLKIDQSFVRDMLDDREDLAIIEAVVSMAHIFERKVIAEGMETSSHGVMLLSLGCDQAQGYGIARPMPADKIPDWLRSWRPDPSWSEWRDTNWMRTDFPLITAPEEHRDWLRSMAHCIEGASPPPQTGCRLGKWLAANDSGAVGKLREIHQRLHDAGEHIVELVERNEIDQARADFSKLERLLELMLIELARLRDEKMLNSTLAS